MDAIPGWGLALAVVSSLGAIIAAITAIWKTRHYEPHETLKLDAETFKSLTESNRIAAETSTDAWKRCQQLEDKIILLQAKVDELTNLVTQLTAKNEVLGAENTVLKQEVKELYDKNFKLNRRVLHLENILKEHGIPPPPGEKANNNE